MTFQAYLDAVKTKTGLSPEDFRALASDKGLLEPGTKAGQVVAWLKADFGLGHGHAMAVCTASTPTPPPAGTPRPSRPAPSPPATRPWPGTDWAPWR
jgi:hypothetical protein